MTERILLVGMMGAGKTTTGKLAAGKLGWAYLDSDAEVQRETGLTVPEIFARDGEAAFRAAETDVLRRACASTVPVVVSVAGGALLRPENRVLVRASGRVVWLRARVETLARRVGDGAGRPLLDDDPAAALPRPRSGPTPPLRRGGRRHHRRRRPQSRGGCDADRGGDRRGRSCRNGRSRRNGASRCVRSRSRWAHAPTRS